MNNAFFIVTYFSLIFNKLIDGLLVFMKKLFKQALSCMSILIKFRACWNVIHPGLHYNSKSESSVPEVVIPIPVEKELEKMKIWWIQVRGIRMPQIFQMRIGRWVLSYTCDGKCYPVAKSYHNGNQVEIFSIITLVWSICWILRSILKISWWIFLWLTQFYQFAYKTIRKGYKIWA